MNGEKRCFSKAVPLRVTLKYLLYLPLDYEPAKRKKWPLVLFLHGMGERGDDLNLVKIAGPPRLADSRKEFPFILVAPQCPDTTMWDYELLALRELLLDLIDKYSVDTSRIYLTGLSMGGFGTWHMAAEDDIGFPERIKVLKNTSIWAFHGAKDETVPVRYSQELIDALHGINANAKLTIYPDCDHDSWTDTYENPDLYYWLLNQSNKRFNI